MTREAYDALLWLGALIAGAAMVCLPGCAWGHREALAYDAGAREAIAQAIAGTQAEIAASLETVRTSSSTADIAMALGSLASSSERIAELAADEIGRARIARVYHGTDPELVVELGSDADKRHVVGMAGLAVNRQARRDAPIKALEFAAGRVSQGARVLREAFVPTWLAWAICIAIVIAIGIGLYALYVRLVVVKRKDRTIEAKDKAIDEYDEAADRVLADKPHDEKKQLFAGEHLRREHQRRKELKESRPFEELRIPVHQHERTPAGGVQGARAMLPDLRTVQTDTAEAPASDAP